MSMEGQIEKSSAAPDPATGCDDPGLFASGFETDFSGTEPATSNAAPRCVFSSHNAPPPAGQPITLAVAYDQPVLVSAVRFVEGDHFPSPEEPTLSGGWFESADVEVRVGSAWGPPPGPVIASAPLDPFSPFQVIDFAFASPIEVTGVRLVGVPGGADRFVTAAEIDALAPPPAAPPVPFDADGSGAANLEDLYHLHANPADLDANGLADDADITYLELFLRWEERADVTTR